MQSTDAALKKKLTTLKISADRCTEPDEHAEFNIGGHLIPLNEIITAGR